MSPSDDVHLREIGPAAAAAAAAADVTTTGTSTSTSRTPPPPPPRNHNTRPANNCKVLQVQSRSLGSLTQNDWQGFTQTFDGKQVEEMRLSGHHHDDGDDDGDDDDLDDAESLWTIRKSHNHQQHEAFGLQRVEVLLEHCTNITHLCLHHCSYLPMVLHKIRGSSSLLSLQDLEIHGIPLCSQQQQQQQQQQQENSVVMTTTTTTTTTTTLRRSPADILVSYLFTGEVGSDDGEGVNDQQQRHRIHRLKRIALHGIEDGDGYATLSTETLLRCWGSSSSLQKLELTAMEVLPSPTVSSERLGRALRTNRSLELLRIRCGRIPQDILLEIGRSLWKENRTLYYVDIGSLEGVTDAVAQTFATVMACNPVFRSLECNLNSITSFNFVSLKNMFCMDISDNLLGDEGALLIANCLPGASIERLNFADNGISRVGASAIAWGVGQCKYLKICNICDNPVTQETDMSTVRSPLARAVFDKVRASLAYSHGFLGMLCAALKDHQNMEHLNLASTGLTDRDGALLALLIRVSCVRQLFLGRNNLADETCGHLYSVLGDDECELTSLHLQLNSITALGFYTLWQGILRTNSKLQSVQIGLRTYSIYGQPRGQRDVDIALRLNQAGRIRLLRDRSATIQEWLECLFAVTDDIDCSFALLRENPSLCTAAGVAKEGRKELK